MLSITAGRVDIAPTLPVAVGIDGRIADRNDGTLEANVLIFKGVNDAPVVLAQIDTMFVDSAFQNALSQQTGIDAARILLLASHSHSTPMLTGTLASPANCERAYSEDVATKIAVLVKQLLSDAAETASAHYGCLQANLNINRRSVGAFFDLAALRRGRVSLARRCAMQPNANGQVDPDLRLLRFDDERGDVRAIVWGYAAHPSRQHDTRAVSADFPGIVRSKLRQQFGSDVAILYVPGAAGSTAPRVPFALPRDLSSLVRWLLPGVPYSPAFTPASYRSWCAQLAARAVEAAMQARAIAADAPSCKQIFSKPIFDGRDPSGDIALNVQSIAFAPNLTLVATSGELLCEWRDVLGGTLGENIWLSGYLAGRPTYVPTSQVLAEGGYEADGFLKPFGMDGKFRSDLEHIVRAVIHEAALSDNIALSHSA